jgi:serine/threonine-protein kinase
VNPAPDHSPYLDLATSLSDGGAVDWTIFGDAGEAVDRDLIRELQLIARIADVHRSVGRELDAPQPDVRTHWGHLEIKGVLGSGSFGTVYRAHDPRLQRDVALKIYQGTVPDDRRLSSLFSEGRLLARVRHHNVVTVHGVEQHGNEVGLWLELVEGRTLAHEVQSGGPLGFREAALIGQDLCRALAAVHQAGLVHRDIKPQNVMRERGGRIVLMDFGIGRDLQAATAAGDLDIGGTPLYMAPELFTGGGSTVASDIYALGVVLFYLVTGSHPVVAPTRATLERAHLAKQRRLLRDLRPDLPDTFVDVVERACALDPARRYSTAGQMQSALSSILGSASEDQRVADSQTAARTTRRSPALWVWAIAASLVAAVAGGFAVMKNRPVAGGVATAPVSAPAVPAPANNETVAAGQYQIRATFYRESTTGPVPLQYGARIAPGDHLFADVSASVPVHVYIVNQDDRGESFLLFPLPGQSAANPLPPGTVHRLPGSLPWQVTSAGGREHFLIVASPEPLGALEAVFEKLPKPRAGAEVIASASLSREAVGQLRGIGGLAPRPSAQSPATELLTRAIALGTDAESARGPWMRQFTLENPGSPR